MGVIQLADVRLRDVFLRFVGIEDGGSILATHVGPLAVELGGIVHHRKAICNIWP